MTRRGTSEQLALYPERGAGLEVFLLGSTGYLTDRLVGTADTLPDAVQLAERRLGQPCGTGEDTHGVHLLSAHLHGETAPSSAVGLIAPAGRYYPYERS